MNITIPKEFLQEGHEVQLKICLHRIESDEQSNSQNADHVDSSNIKEIRVTLDDGRAVLPKFITDVSNSLTSLARKVPQLLVDTLTLFFVAIILFMWFISMIIDLVAEANRTDDPEIAIIEQDDSPQDVDQIQENEETSVINNTTQYLDAADGYDADHSNESSIHDNSTYPFRNAQETLILDTTELDLLDDLMDNDSTTYATLSDEDILSEHDEVQQSFSGASNSAVDAETEMTYSQQKSNPEIINDLTDSVGDATTSNANVDSNEQTDDADSQRKNSTLNTAFLTNTDSIPIMKDSIISIADSSIETIQDSSKDDSLNSTPHSDDNDSGMDHADYSSSEASNSSAVTAIAAGNVQESDSLIHHQKLLDVITLALDNLPSSDENDKFVEDLRMRQEQRKIEMEQIALENADLNKSDHEQNVELKCLACIINGDTGDHVCAICGASFGNTIDHLYHQIEYHGGFTLDENDE